MGEGRIRIFFFENTRSTKYIRFALLYYNTINATALRFTANCWHRDIILLLSPEKIELQIFFFPQKFYQPRGRLDASRRIGSACVRTGR